MKLVVLSDTHIPERAAQLPEPVLSALDQADGVLHAGDFTDMATLRLLQERPGFTGVAGNMDTAPVRRSLRPFDVVSVAGLRIGLIHGWGPPGPLPAMLHAELAREKLDAIVYGHSHQALNEVMGDVRLFNPGSVTDNVFAPFRSYGLLTVTAETGIQGEIIKITEGDGA